MTAPNLSSYMTQMRADGHKPKLYMSAFRGSVVLSATLTTKPTFPALNLSISVVSGSSSNVKRGMRVVFRTPSGAFKGWTSVRYAGTISSTRLPIRETGQGEFDLDDGDTVEVYDVFMLSDKLVAADSTFAPDHEAYVDQNSLVAPLVRSGGYWAGPLDPGQSYATVPFVGTSETVDEDSGATVTHSWSAPTATGSTSSSSASPTFTFPAGEHHVTHEGTDDSNSVIFTQRLKVYVDTDPFQIQLDRWDTEETTGASATITMLSSATLDELPDGTLVCLWHPAYVVPRAAVASRSHIFMLGYLRQDSWSVEFGNRSLTFEIQSPLAKLAELAGFSKVMIRKTSPSKWREIEGLTVRRAVLVLMRSYTNICDIGFDFEYDAADYQWNRFYLQGTVPRDQVNELADGVDARFVCDRTGRIMVQQRLELLDISDRSAETVVLTATARDILRVDGGREHHQPIQQVQGEGFIASATRPTPILARWPSVPGRGADKPTYQRLIATDRASFNRRIGMRGAAANRTYTRSNGVQQHAPEITLTLRGSYDVFDWYRYFIELDLPASSNPRGVNLSAFRWLMVGASVSWSVRERAMTTTLRLKAETAGRAAKKYERPTSAQVDLPPFTPPTFSTGISNPGAVGLRLPVWTGQVGNLPDRIFAVSANSAECAIGAIDWLLGTITWTIISTGLTGTGQHATGDPYDYARRIVLTTDGLFTTDDPWAFDAWEPLASNAEMFGSSSRIGWKIAGNITKRNHFIVGCGHNLAVTLDGTNSWDQVNPSGVGSWSTSAAIGTGQTLDDFAINPTGGGIVLTAHYASGGSSNFFRSTSNGQSFSSWSTTPTAFVSPRLFYPYRRSGGAPNLPNASHEVWMSFIGGLAKSTNGGATWTYGYSGAGANAPAAGMQNVLAGFTWDMRKHYSAELGLGGGANRWGIAATVDGTTYTHPQNGNAGHQDAISLNGWPLNPDCLLMYSRSGALLKVSPDGAVTIFGTVPTGWTGVAYAEFDLSEEIPSGGGT